MIIVEIKDINVRYKMPTQVCLDQVKCSQKFAVPDPP